RCIDYKRGAIGASWRSGYAADCKSVYLGSIPGEASIDLADQACRAKSVYVRRRSAHCSFAARHSDPPVTRPLIEDLGQYPAPLASRTREARSSGETGPLVREQRGKASVRAHWGSTFALMQFRPIHLHACQIRNL